MRMITTSVFSILLATTAHAATDDEADYQRWKTTRNVAGTAALAGLVALPVGGLLMMSGVTDGGGGQKLEEKLSRRYGAGSTLLQHQAERGQGLVSCRPGMLMEVDRRGLDGQAFESDHGAGQDLAVRLWVQSRMAGVSLCSPVKADHDHSSMPTFPRGIGNTRPSRNLLDPLQAGQPLWHC